MAKKDILTFWKRGFIESQLLIHEATRTLYR